MNNIKTIRKKQNITITELAQKIGMSQANLTKIENNQIELKIDLAKKLATFFNVPLETIINIPSQTGNKIELINPEALNLPQLSQIEYPIPNLKSNIKGFVQKDDTMAPLIPKHSIVVVDTLKNEIENAIFLVSINNSKTLRRIQPLDEEQVLILTENKSYNHLCVKNKEIKILAKAIGDLSYTSI